MDVVVIILAAGRGTRMRSSIPKVLHRLAGKTLVEHVIDTARALRPQAIHLVYGHGGELVEAQLAAAEVNWVLQEAQLGTGHAVEQALPEISDDALVLVLYGDVPLIRARTLEALLAPIQAGCLGLLTVDLADPAGYGRIVRGDGGRVERIVEDKDASGTERQIQEINTGIMAVPAGLLKGWIARLENANSQGEFYLTDIVALAVAEGVEVVTVQPGDAAEVRGVNDRVQLAELERHYQLERARELMLAGVTLLDPQRFDVRGSLVHGLDVEVDVNVVLEGEVRLGNHVRIGANCIIRDSELGDGVAVLANTIIESASVGAHSRVGPFARLRPGTHLAEHVHVGNFVEAKNARIGEASKANHLTYLGDCSLGAHVNVGAGTITCNYDGAAKHETIIGDDVFVGSNAALVAPIQVGSGATIGAGSTLTRDAPSGQLTLARAHQVTIAHWERPRKQR
jgi:bifunctional UDP-N-acetylglucosamine pyrophosphorylase/glucosamine-1-phosphate N-acetyltransferase